MKRYSIVFLFAFSLTLSVFSQKNVNVDNLRFNTAYKVSPIKPLDPLFFYYSSVVRAPKSLEQKVSMQEIDQALYIESQRKDYWENADVSIELILGDIIINSSDVKERYTEDKDKDGKVTRNYYFWVEVIYSFESSYIIRRGPEVLLRGGLDYRNMNKFYRTTEYPRGKSAADFWNNNRHVLIPEFARNLSLEAAYATSRIATANYGFPTIRSTDIIKTINEKKHPENDAFRAASNSLKNRLEGMTGEIPMDENAIEGIIDYFKNIPAKYTDPKSKADIRLRYAAYYNLCKIYIYLDQPEKVAKYAELLFENGHDKDDCDKMKKLAGEIQAMFDKTQVKTRHFNSDDYFN